MRIPRIPAAVLLAAIVLASCTNWRATDAARVADEAIPASELRDEVEIMVSAPIFSQLVYGLPSELAPPPDASEEEVEAARQNADLLRWWLQRRIEGLAAEELAASLELVAGEEDLAQVEDDLRFRLELTEEARPEAAGATAQLDQLPEPFRNELLRGLAARRVVEELVAEAEIEALGGSPDAFFDEQRSDYDVVCVTGVAVADAAEARAVGRQLEDAEDPAQLAQERFAGLSGSECLTAVRLGSVLGAEAIEELRDEPEGTAVGPVELPSGLWVFVLTETEPARFDDVESDVRIDYLIAREEAVLAPYREALDAVGEDVWVDPRYGRWDADAFQLLPNRGPEPAGPRGDLEVQL